MNRIFKVHITPEKTKNWVNLEGPSNHLSLSEFDLEQMGIFYRFLNIEVTPPWPGFWGLVRDSQFWRHRRYHRTVKTKFHLMSSRYKRLYNVWPFKLHRIYDRFFDSGSVLAIFCELLTEIPISKVKTWIQTKLTIYTRLDVTWVSDVTQAKN